MTDYNKCEIVDISIYAGVNITIGWWNDEIYGDLYYYLEKSKYFIIKDHKICYEWQFVFWLEDNIPKSEIQKLDKYIHNLDELFDTLNYTAQWYANLSK